MSFLAEIKRRKVFQVAAVYAVVAWLLVQIVGELNDPLSLPPWFDTVVIVLMAVGFPLALVLAWAFDLTPEGVVRTPAAGAPTATEPQEDATPGPAVPVPPSSSASPQSGSPAQTLRNSVAVLPLENLSPNPDDAFFAAGIHEEILNQLTKIKDLSVIARTSVKKYRDSDKSIAEIAAELGVGTIMEGSVRYAGRRVRVAAQLIDAATAKHLWSEVYERDLADVFAIQADVAEKIARALEAEFSVAEQQSIEKLPTSSPEAYALYLRALAIMQEHGQTVGASPDVRSTIESYLDQAIALDPSFALPYVARARLSASRLNQDPGVYEDSESLRAELEDRTLRDARQALALDPGIGAAHGILARIHQFNWRGSEARNAYRRALELSPNDPDVLMDFAVFSALSSGVADSLELANQAIRLDPDNPWGRHWLAAVHLRLGDGPAALEDMRLAVNLSPIAGMAHILLGLVEAVWGIEAAALTETRVGERLVHDATNPVFFGHLAYNYALLGLRADAERMLSRLEEIAETRRVPSTAWIYAYLALGDEEQTFHWLDTAAKQPEAYVGHFALMFAKHNLFSDPLLERPAFRAARERIGYTG